MESLGFASNSPISVVLVLLSITVVYVIYSCGQHVLDFSTLLRILVTVKRAKKRSVIDIIEEMVDKFPKRVQFISVEDGRETTLGEMETLANQVANWGETLGCKKGETIAMLMHSSSDFVAIWFGFGKIGVASALLNTNTKGKSLLHCVETVLKDSSTKIFMIDQALKIQITDEEIAQLQALDVQVYFWDIEESNPLSVKSTITVTYSSSRISKEKRSGITPSDPYIYIFTSGTTGLPKACKVAHHRFQTAGYMGQMLCGLTPQDRYYNVLPLYHSAAGLIALSACIMSGACLVTRRKFSASRFAEDCARYKCTIFQYIGELCRYLLATPASPPEDHLRLRVAIGNGMRPECWEKFQKRFNIGKVIEFYAATEGNVFLVNNCNRVGALGYLPPFLDFLYPSVIVSTDAVDKSKPYRDLGTGRSRVSPYGEPGLLCGPIIKAKRDFDGYTDKKATEDKLLRGLFKKDDLYFNTGDLITRDAQGFFYWSDRAGDTFRWKGENVATSEIASVLSQSPEVLDATVYGVPVPGCDGKAGMAAITANPDTAPQKLLADLYNLATRDLPPYARPLFVRYKKLGCEGEGQGEGQGGGINLPSPSSSGGEMEKEAKYTDLQTTATFKHIKGDLVKEGFDPSLMKEDTLYYLDFKAGCYHELTPESFKSIKDGKLKF